MRAVPSFAKYLLALAVFAAMQESSSANSFEWREFLGGSASKLIGALSDMAECDTRPLTFEIPYISEQTVVQPNFERPVSGGLISNTPPVIAYPQIKVLTCKIKDGAVIHGLVGHSGVFRISIFYDRCTERAAAGACLSDDLAEKPYDKKLYDGMSIKDAYSVVGSPPDRNEYFERYESLNSDEDNRRRLALAECSSTVRPDVDTSYRCLVDAEFENGVFVALSMWELFKEGMFSEEVIARLASQQVFIAADAEKAELYDFMNFVSSAVKGERAKMDEKAAQGNERDKRLDSLLGTQQ